MALSQVLVPGIPFARLSFGLRFSFGYRNVAFLIRYGDFVVVVLMQIHSSLMNSGNGKRDPFLLHLSRAGFMVPVL